MAAGGPSCHDCSAPISAQSRTGRCRKCCLRYLNGQPWFQRVRKIGIGMDPDKRIDCSGCGKILGPRNRTGLCLTCFNKDPAYSRKRGAGLSRAIYARLERDPEFAARYREKGRKLGLSGLGNAAAPAGGEIRQRMGRAMSELYLGWCPPEYRSSYRDLVRNKKLGVPEAKRRTLERAHNDRLSRLVATSLSSAIDFLRPFAPVLPRENGFLYGTVILTPEQIVERAQNKGWVAA